MKKQNAITLIALIITIIVLLILAGVTISMLTGENSILRNAKLAAEETRAAAVEEKVMLWKTEIMLAENLGGIAKDLDGILTELQGEGLLTGEEVDEIKADENNEITIGSKTISFNTEYVPPEKEPEEPVIVVNKKTDGSWNEEEKVNTPNLENTGLIPIYFDESGNTVELTDASTDAEWDKWYNYDNNEWANAITKDEDDNITGYFVWIPRFAYKITNNLGVSGENVSGTILVKFLQGTTINDEDGNAVDNENAGETITRTYPTVTNNAMANYVVHPSFTDGTANRWQNGEWDEEIEGFWVAKYEAGFQKSTTNEAGTVINGTDTVVFSTNKYTSYYSSYTTNALDQTLTQAGYANEHLSYPVFKPLTYAYNVISTGDSYTISQEIASATEFYGLANIDSHMMKNSEWGAVAYLTQSEYGRDGTEVTINEKNLNNLNSKIIYAVTGYEGTNTPLGVNASSTGNITGVFDLSGGTWERTAGYITNKNASLTSYGANYAYDDTAETNPSTRSTKWATAYPYVSTDTSAANWTNFNTNFKTTRFGDAILEVSSASGGAYGWKGDYSYFPYSTYPFFVRGGRYGYGSDAGSFAFDFTDGDPYYNYGFRAVLIPETVNN